MSVASISINLSGLALIGLIVWWFWLNKPRAQQIAGATPIEIVVADGVYSPPRIEVPAGKPVTLRFLRRDPSPCAARVIFDALDVSAELPVGEPKDVIVQVPRPGEVEFTCEMRMYRGALVAR